MGTGAFHCLHNADHHVRIKSLPRSQLFPSFPLPTIASGDITTSHYISVEEKVTWRDICRFTEALQKHVVIMYGMPYLFVIQSDIQQGSATKT